MAGELIRVLDPNAVWVADIASSTATSLLGTVIIDLLVRPEGGMTRIGVLLLPGMNARSADLGHDRQGSPRFPCLQSACMRFSERSSAPVLSTRSRSCRGAGEIIDVRQSMSARHRTVSSCDLEGGAVCCLGLRCPAAHALRTVRWENFTGM